MVFYPYLPIPPPMHMYSPGPWSDRHGRKLLILIPILGQVLTCTTFILNVVLFDLLPFEALYMEYINELRQRMFRFELKLKKNPKRHRKNHKNLNRSNTYDFWANNLVLFSWTGLYAKYVSIDSFPDPDL